MAVGEVSDGGAVVRGAGVCGVGQASEGNGLRAERGGGGVKRHPVGVICAVWAGGGRFGCVGVMLAVPAAAAAAAGVLVRYAVERYQDSALYHGDEQDGAPREP